MAAVARALTSQAKQVAPETKKRAWGQEHRAFRHPHGSRQGRQCLAAVQQGRLRAAFPAGSPPPNPLGPPTVSCVRRPLAAAAGPAPRKGCCCQDLPSTMSCVASLTAMRKLLADQAMGRSPSTIRSCKGFGARCEIAQLMTARFLRQSRRLGNPPPSATGDLPFAGELGLFAVHLACVVEELLGLLMALAGPTRGRCRRRRQRGRCGLRVWCKLGGTPAVRVVPWGQRNLFSPRGKFRESAASRAVRWLRSRRPRGARGRAGTDRLAAHRPGQHPVQPPRPRCAAAR